MPKFPGGDAELLKFIAKSIKYPVIAQENGIQGRVICAFVVNRDGSVVDAEVLRGVDPSLDKEALRVIGTMPKWTPGKQRGKPVRVKYTAVSYTHLVEGMLEQTEKQVLNNEISSFVAAKRMIDLFLDNIATK